MTGLSNESSSRRGCSNEARARKTHSTKMASTAAIGLCCSHLPTVSFPSSPTTTPLRCDDPLVLFLKSSQRNHHFVSCSYSSALSSDSGNGQTNVAEESQATRIERLWQDFFSDPSQWLDYRFEKKSSKHPDFKHKITREALWINRFSPPWVPARLAAMAQGRERSFSSISEISGQAARREQLWQEFFSDPSQWWDHRFKKTIIVIHFSIMVELVEFPSSMKDCISSFQGLLLLAQIGKIDDRRQVKGNDEGVKKFLLKKA